MRTSSALRAHVKMAKCLRLALSATSKYLQSRAGLSFTHSSLSRTPACTRRGIKQFSTAAIAPCVQRSPRTLSSASVKVCSCGPHRQVHTEVDKELARFLDSEIQFEEKQVSQNSRLQTKAIEGFQVSTEDAEVILTKKMGDETIKVKFSVNASVDSAGALHPEDEKQPEPEMVSQPPFTVEISKGDGQTLTLHCSFVSPEEMDAGQEGPQDAETIVDSFEIQEVALHKGEYKDTVYSVQADIMDGNLYDLLMDMLDARGINDEFANQLVDFSTGFEHNRYVSFLKDLKQFVGK